MLNKQAYTIVGVMEKGFESDPAADLCLPLQADPRLLGSLLYGVKSSDPATFAGVAVIVTAVAAVATCVPARRASAIAPSDALRHQ